MPFSPPLRCTKYPVLGLTSQGQTATSVRHLLIHLMQIRLLDLALAFVPLPAGLAHVRQAGPVGQRALEGIGQGLGILRRDDPACFSLYDILWQGAESVTMTGLRKK